MEDFREQHIVVEHCRIPGKNHAPCVWTPTIGSYRVVEIYVIYIGIPIGFYIIIIYF
jgi:hypothetical protein